MVKERDEARSNAGGEQDESRSLEQDRQAQRENEDRGRAERAATAAERAEEAAENAEQGVRAAMSEARDMAVTALEECRAIAAETLMLAHEAREARDHVTMYARQCVATVDAAAEVAAEVRTAMMDIATAEEMAREALVDRVIQERMDMAEERARIERIVSEQRSERAEDRVQAELDLTAEAENRDVGFRLVPTRQMQMDDLNVSVRRIGVHLPFVGFVGISR